jgi:hypothetical protein
MQKVREASGGSQQIFGEPWRVVKRKIRKIKRIRSNIKLGCRREECE